MYFYYHIHVLLIKTNPMIYICCIKYQGMTCVLTVRDNDDDDVSSSAAKGHVLEDHSDHVDEREVWLCFPHVRPGEPARCVWAGWVQAGWGFLRALGTCVPRGFVIHIFIIIFVFYLLKQIE